MRNSRMRARMIRLLLILVVVLSPVLSLAEIHTFTPEYLQEKNYTVVASMPCNWDRETATVTVFAYYGETGADDTLYQTNVEAELQRPFGGMDLAVRVPSSIAGPVDGRPLHHLEIDFQVTSRTCDTGFGFPSNH